MSWKLEDRIVARLDEAISEAERFLARAKLAQKALKAGDGTAYRCYEFAAAKRASLDLATALVSLRRGTNE